MGMNIVILGPQGSGKGTQSEMLANKYNLLHVETGKILREIASSNEPMADEIRRTMLEGKLVSDVVLEAVIGQVMKDNRKNGIVFDGTPRNEGQYDLIKRLLKNRNEKIDRFIVIEISETETIKRLTSRLTCKNCGNVYNTLTKPPTGNVCECGGELVVRDDDSLESIKKRLQVYHEMTAKVISLAKNENILYEINGERPIEEIFNDIVRVIEN